MEPRKPAETKHARSQSEIAIKSATLERVAPESRSLTAEDLAHRSIARRAVEAAIWGMPAVNYQLMYEEMVRKVNGRFNQVLCWSRLPDWKNQTLTPNPDVIYLMPFFNTKDVGPVVPS